MTPTTPSHVFVQRAPLILAFFGVTCLSAAQEAHHWTDRENLGLKGPVLSVRTSITRPNPDPRPLENRKLFVEGHSDWAVFDRQGKRTEIVSSSSGDNIVAVSKCSFEPDGSRTCVEDTGQKHQSREQRSTLPDGSREVIYFQDSKVVGRDVTRFDEQGKSIGVKSYGSNGQLHSEEIQLPNGDQEWKIYDEGGTAVSDMRTRESDDKNRIDRWFYDSEGRLMWNIAIAGDGSLLSHWYNVGFKEKLSTSGSLGACIPGLCVDYKFDEQGSGRLERSIQHTQGPGMLEPESEEHINFDGILDEKATIKYTRDGHDNWTTRSVFLWDSTSNLMVEIERDTRTIVYF